MEILNEGNGSMRQSQQVVLFPLSNPNSSSNSSNPTTTTTGVGRGPERKGPGSTAGGKVQEPSWRKSPGWDLQVWMSATHPPQVCNSGYLQTPHKG